MKPQPTASTTIYTFDYSDLGKIELGWGPSSTEDLGHQGGIGSES